jgi:hypothetical protein
LITIKLGLGPDRQARAVLSVPASRSYTSSTGKPELYFQYQQARAILPVPANQSCTSSTGKPELYFQYQQARAILPVLGKLGRNKIIIRDKI